MTAPLEIQSFQKPVIAQLTIPGSKSYTLRALILAALTCMNGQPVTLDNPLVSDDPAAMIACLRALGVHIVQDQQSLEVQGWALPDAASLTTLDCDMSGATIRFLLALCCVIPGRQVLQGKPRLNERPIADLVDALRQLGAKITYLKQPGYPPVQVESGTLRKNTVAISGKTSSQFLSALLMIGPMISGGLTVEITDELISKPYVEMTLDIMNSFGIQSTPGPLGHPVLEGEGFGVPAQPYRAKKYAIEADVSSACYFGAIAALTQSTIHLNNMNPDSKQGDMQFFEILAEMGNAIRWEGQTLIIEGKGIKPVTANMAGCPDQAQTLAVLAAFAQGPTHLSGIKSLRVKETERVIALENELAKMGIKTESTEDSLTIHGGSPKAATIATYGDHRMAMAFAVAGTRLSGLRIENPEVVAKTFPNFWDAMAKLNPLQTTPTPEQCV